MATARKPFTPSKSSLAEREVYREFIDALVVTRTIVANKLVDTKDSKGKVKLDYDDPNG